MMLNLLNIVVVTTVRVSKANAMGFISVGAMGQKRSQQCRLCSELSLMVSSIKHVD